MSTLTTTLSNALGNDPVNIKIDGLNPEKFKNVVSKSADVLAHMGIPIVKPIEESASTTALKEASNLISETLANPTREAYERAKEALENLTAQSLISEEVAKQMAKAVNTKVNPHHYVLKKKKKPLKFAEPSKFHGRSKGLVHIETSKGVKLMTLKIAKKLGFI